MEFKSDSGDVRSNPESESLRARTLKNHSNPQCKESESADFFGGLLLKLNIIHFTST